MNIIKTTLPLILVMTLIGCASTAQFTYDYDEEIDFTTYQTLDWIPPSGDIVDPLGEHPTVAFRLNNAIRDDLPD